MKELIKIVSVSLLIAFVLFVIDILFDYASNREVEYNLRLIKVFGFYVMYSLPLTVVNSSLFNYLNERVVWKRYKQYRLAIGFFGSIILTIGTLFLVRLFHRMSLDGASYNEFLSAESMTFYYTATIITIAVSMFFHAFYFHA